MVKTQCAYPASRSNQPAGVEIDSELADSERAVILDQVKNGIAVRMAILYLSPKKQKTSKKMTDYCLKRRSIDRSKSNLDENLGRMAECVCFTDDTIESFDFSGKIIMPGLVTDIRGHLREPESLASIGEAAAFGGYTTILLMPNGASPADNPGTVHLMREKASKDTSVEILQCGCLTKASEGEVLAPLGSLKEAGVVAVSDCPSSPQNTEIFARGLEYASMFGLPVIEFPAGYGDLLTGNRS